MPRINGTYRILALDGGGSWALIEIQALKALWEALNLRDPKAYPDPDPRGWVVLREFDLVAANSGGNFVLAGLACNWRLSDMLTALADKTDNQRSTIFYPLTFWQKLGTLSNWIFKTFGKSGPRYSAAKKLDGIRAVYGSSPPKFLGPMGAPSDPALPHADADTPLDALAARISAANGVPTNFLITSFDYDRERAQFFRSNTASPASGLPPAATATLAEAVHASTNAPIFYFDAPARFTDPVANPSFANSRFWDGAIAGYNNPVLAAMVEAVADPSLSPFPILNVISIGTGKVFLPLPDPAGSVAPGVNDDAGVVSSPNSEGFVSTISEMATSIGDDPPDAASFIALMLGKLDAPAAAGIRGWATGSGTLVRMNPLIQPQKSPAGAVRNAAGQRTWSWTVPGPLKAVSGDAGQSAFQQLVNLDMDAVEQPQVELIFGLGNAWVGGLVPNQPIRSGADLDCEIGDATFTAALARALAFF